MRIEKKQLIKDIGDILEGSNFLYLINYKGLKVKDFEELRTNLSKINVKCHVLKNTMIKKAAELKNMPTLASIKFAGDTALISGNCDPSAAAKVLSEFVKKFEFLGFKSGYLENSVLSSADVEAIAKLPSREVLYAQLLGVLQAPARNLVSILNAKLASPIYVLSAYKGKKSNT